MSGARSGKPPIARPISGAHEPDLRRPLIVAIVLAGYAMGNIAALALRLH